MTYLIIGGALAFIVLMLRIPGVVGRRRITNKVQSDYARCRGTIHARQLHAGIKKHEASIPPLIRERDMISKQLESLSRTETKDLRRALEAALAHGPLAEVRGIGPKLRDRIIDACFDGTLQSLGQAEHVSGVGEEKAEDIRSWIQELHGKIPQLLKGDFKGKAEVLFAYGKQRDELLRQQQALDTAINARRDLVAQVKGKLATLELTTLSTYRAALEGDEQAAERVAAHTLGAFPEWESEPPWFQAITSDPEDFRR